MKKREAIVITVLFALLIALPLALTLFREKREFSEWENRNLAAFPALTAESVFSGEFGQSFESWLTDHFAFRDSLVKLKRRADAALMIREAGGIVIGENGLFDIPEKVDEKAVSKNVSAINSFCEKYSLPTTLILVPSAAEVFPNSPPALAPRTEESRVIDEIYSSLEGARTLDAVKALQKLDYSEAFYKTDHHWTSRGAAEVYKAWQGDRNFEFETVSEEFYGTLTSRSGDLSVKADLIEKITSGDAFSYVSGDEKRDSMYFDDYLEKKDKYSYFLGTNKALVELSGGVQNGKTLLVFKDSFAHSFVQCAAVDFERVILVDLRYVTSPISTLIDTDEIDEVLFLYSTETFTTLDNMVFLNI